MPGGKIAFYYGILERLQLVDDEVATVMGHEMAHALREHAREQMGKGVAARGAVEIGSEMLGLGTGGRLLADLGRQLPTLKFSRDDETEADLSASSSPPAPATTRAPRSASGKRWPRRASGRRSR